MRVQCDSDALARCAAWGIKPRGDWVPVDYYSFRGTSLVYSSQV
jgi:hypothetical protein